MGEAARPERVAAAALRDLGRHGTVRPGFQSKALGWSLRMLPRGMRVLAMGRIMQGMAEKIDGAFYDQTPLKRGGFPEQAAALRRRLAFLGGGFKARWHR